MQQRYTFLANLFELLLLRNKIGLSLPPNFHSMKFFISALFALTFSLGIFAQDTITVMQYNLLYYGEITGFCNNNNNSLEMKDPHLRTILDYVKPDIFTVNELSSDENVHEHLLDNNLNINFITHYKRAESRNTAGSNIVNMLYYDSRKLRLKTQFTAQNYVRDVDVYELYYYSNDLQQGDTAFVVCVVGHLKAGNSSGDANARKIMAENTLRFLETRYENDNVLFMGDFNFYTGAESAFQLMLNYSNTAMRFLDPIGQIGDWNNNSFYAGIHTQSTNTNSDCKAGGGLDDRFDFILISDEIRFGTNHVRYVQESFKAVGQDGQHFNGTVNGAPQNTSVPSAVATALFNFSDHLPITMKLAVDKTLDIAETSSRPFLAEIIPNPVKSNARIDLYMPQYGNLKLQLTDLNGKVIISQSYSLMAGKQTLDVNLENLPSGIYFVSLQDGNRRNEHMKLIKQSTGF